MQEYKISADELDELNDLINEGYEVYEVNTYMGLAEIKLVHFENVVDVKTIILEKIKRGEIL